MKMRNTRHWSMNLLIAITLTLTGAQVAARCYDEASGRGSEAMSLADRVGWTAREFVRLRPPLHREDCSGLVEAVLAQSGVLQQGSVRSFWAQAVAEHRAYRGAAPQPGHLAFFDYTYDANHNGVADDILTHVGIVTAVDDEGTVQVVHRPRGGIRTLQLNLRQPETHRQGERVLNDFVRAPGYGPREGRRLAGQLVYGFAAPPAPMLPMPCTCAPVLTANSVR
ncbi:MAG: CHAP domain-containing protein [Pseudomonadota bacterium]